MNYTTKKTLRPTFDIIRLWTIIITAYIIGIKVDSIFIWPLLAMFSGAALHGFLILMHDAVHYSLYQNRFLNEFIGNTFCSNPCGFSVNRYRIQHLAHHKSVNTLRDPYFYGMQILKSYQLPKSKKELITVFFKNLLMCSLKEQYTGAKIWLVTSNFFSSEKKNDVVPLNNERIYVLLSISTFLSVIFYFGAWSFLVFHFVSLLFMAMFAHIRAISEHPYIRHNGDDKKMSFTVNAPTWENFFIAPCNANTHYAHHVNPNVPYYNLQKFSDSVVDNDNIVFNSYLFGKNSVFNEVTIKKHGQ